MNENQEQGSPRIDDLITFAKNLRECSSQAFEEFDNTVFMVDLMGRIIYFNRAAELLLGYTREEILGRHFRTLLTLDDLSDGFLFFYQTLQGCYAEHTLFRVRRKDGSTRVIDVLASPISFGGRVRAGLAIAQDVTGQKSTDPGNEERVKAFKKFSEDLDQWNQSRISQNPDSSKTQS